LVQNALSRPQFLLEESNQIKIQILNKMTNEYKFYIVRELNIAYEEKKNTYLVIKFGFKFSSTMISGCNS